MEAGSCVCTLHHPPGPRPGTARPAGTPAAFQGQRQEVLEGWGCRQATGGPTRKAQPPTLGVFPRGRGGCVPLCTTPGGPSVPTEFQGAPQLGALTTGHPDRLHAAGTPSSVACAPRSGPLPPVHLEDGVGHGREQVPTLQHGGLPEPQGQRKGGSVGTVGMGGAA